MRNHTVSISITIAVIVMSLFSSSCENEIEDNPISPNATLHFDISLPEENVFSRFILMTNASFGNNIVNESNSPVILDTLYSTESTKHLVFDISLITESVMH